MGLASGASAIAGEAHVFPTEYADTPGPLTSRIHKSILPMLTSDFDEIFSGGEKCRGNSYLTGTRSC
jgi:hypothetical protein